MALAPTFVQFDGLRLGQLTQPNAVELDDGRDISDGVTVGELLQRFELIDAFIDRAQADTAAQRGTPCLAQLAQTLAQATAKEDLLIHIEPKASVFFQDRIGADDIVSTALALQHWDLQPLYVPPPGF